MIANAVAHQADHTAATVFWITISVILYFVPTVVAWVRRVPHAMSVTVINFFTGWTLIGWVIALAMACRSGHLRNTVTGEKS